MNQIIIFLIFLSVALVCSTLLYAWLRQKTKIGARYLYLDNPVTALLSALIAFGVYRLQHSQGYLIRALMMIASVGGIAFLLTMIRFWRTPRRRVSAGPGQVVSPADGNIIYIKELINGECPVAIKLHRFSKLEELVKTPLLSGQGLHIGINMTPFDVHKNCAPISGKIILNRHFSGKFYSLKDFRAQTENERNTYIIRNDELEVGVVQIASRLVRRIDSYVKTGDEVRQGEWIGMIRFGSQVDVILPAGYRPAVSIGEQVYAAKTILAEKG
ncbi:MAG: phosphatidylserine decarboxylase [Bacteroidales bacterium]|nr:phosphatidylserine decarboxylase [Bacteroidales bacterium]MDT8374979.1 phosphatidylserine decarboxylase [Bacteroidales bacterium]